MVKINFPGSAARQTNFTANTNQSNESVTVVKINIQSGTNQFFFSPVTTYTSVPATRAQAEIDFYCGGGN